jgi:hypothetical protein
MIGRAYFVALWGALVAALLAVRYNQNQAVPVACPPAEASPGAVTP